MKKEEKKKEEKQKEKFRAETLIRNASANNARYIVNADRKSRILIFVNAAIISVLISLTGFQVPNEILPEIPKALLLIANIASLLFALKSVEAAFAYSRKWGQGRTEKPFRFQTLWGHGYRRLPARHENRTGRQREGFEICHRRPIPAGAVAP